MAESLSLDLLVAGVHFPDQITLAPSPPIAVSVVRSDGRAADSATVHQVFYLGDPNPIYIDISGLDGMRVLHRRYQVNEGGDVVVESLPGLSWIWAEEGGLESERWVG